MLLSVRFKPFAFLLSLALLTAETWPTAAATAEELIAAEDTPAGITITVSTGGCTKKSDFEVSSSSLKNGEASVEFRRRNRDTCKGNFPDGTKLEFTWGDLKLPQGTKLLVKNPIEQQPLAIVAPVKKTEQIKPEKQNERQVSAKPKGPTRARHLRHRHLHRHHAKVHAGSHRRAHAQIGGHRYCHRLPHSRKCRHLTHVRTHRHHRHRHHHGAYCPFIGNF